MENTKKYFTGTGFLDCCTHSLQYMPNTSEQCAPIDIPEDDPFYSKYGARCMSMPRTDTNRDHNCDEDTDEIEKVNMSTSILNTVKILNKICALKWINMYMQSVLSGKQKYFNKITQTATNTIIKQII